MLVGRCSSELSGHRLQGKLKKSQPPSAADLSRRAVEGSALTRAWANKIRFLLLIGCGLTGNQFRVALMNEGHGFRAAEKLAIG